MKNTTAVVVDNTAIDIDTPVPYSVVDQGLEDPIPYSLEAPIEFCARFVVEAPHVTAAE